MLARIICFRAIPHTNGSAPNVSPPKPNYLQHVQLRCEHNALPSQDNVTGLQLI